MTVTITNDIGETVTATDIKEAKRIEARMKREEKKRQEADNLRRKEARRNADERAMVFVRLAYEKDNDGGLRPLPRGYQYESGDTNPELKPGELCGWRTNTFQVYSGEWAELSNMYSWQVIGSVTASYGIALLHIRERETKREFFAAVGVYEGIVALSPIPEEIPLSPDRFNRSAA